MAKSLRREAMQRLGVCLRLRSKLAEQHIDSSVRDLASRLAAKLDRSLGDVRDRPFVLANAESIEVPQDACRALAQLHSSGVDTTAERSRAENAKTRTEGSE